MQSEIIAGYSRLFAKIITTYELNSVILTEIGCALYKGVLQKDIISPSPDHYLPPNVCWNGVLCGHFLGIIEMNVWAHSYKILLVFEVPYQPWVKGMPEKAKTTKSC
jgi:hypothetical protein